MAFPTDIVRGTVGDDTLSANSQGSQVRGGPGNDVIRGGKGDDFILGGAGDDILSGGKGADQFRFSGVDMGGGTDTDRIVDLNFGEGDKIVFNDFGAGTFKDVYGGNNLQILNSGASAILDSWADIVELANANTTVTASGNAALNLLILTIDAGELGTQVIRISNGWNSYVAAGGTEGVPLLA